MTSNLKKTLILLKTLRKDITILFFICIATIICIDFWLKDIEELFIGGAKIGDIIYKLFMSYISAFIFYFLVIHIKAQKDKINLYTYVAKKVYMVIGSSWGLIQEISKAANVSIENKYPSQTELESICKAINPNSNAPLLLGNPYTYATWIQYLNFQKQRSNEATAKIFLKMPFLDTQLVKLLANIEDCTYFMGLKHLENTPIRNTDLTFQQNSLSKYLDLIKDLEKYADKKLKDYK